MKKIFKSKIAVTVVAIMILSFSLPSLAANPGSEADPLVTMSYVNDVLMPQMKSYVDTKTAQLELPESPSVPANSFVLLDLKKGQTVIGGQSTEFILRSGSATVVATKKGGLADVTFGSDLPDKSEMPLNHLLIIPFDDWRGVKMTSDGYLMVKGAYSIQ